MERPTPGFRRWAMSWWSSSRNGEPAAVAGPQCLRSFDSLELPRPAIAGGACAHAQERVSSLECAIRRRDFGVLDRVRADGAGGGLVHRSRGIERGHHGLDGGVVAGGDGDGMDTVIRRIAGVAHGAGDRRSGRYSVRGQSQRRVSATSRVRLRHGAEPGGHHDWQHCRAADGGGDGSGVWMAQRVCGVRCARVRLDSGVVGNDDKIAREAYGNGDGARGCRHDSSETAASGDWPPRTLW